MEHKNPKYSNLNRKGTKKKCGLKLRINQVSDFLSIIIIPQIPETFVLIFFPAANKNLG